MALLKNFVEKRRRKAKKLSFSCISFYYALFLQRSLSSYVVRPKPIANEVENK